MVTYRKANASNLMIGSVSIFFGIVGMVSFTFNLSNANLFWGMCFVLVFVLIGGYETGKYAEMRHERERKTTQKEQLSDVVCK